MIRFASITGRLLGECTADESSFVYLNAAAVSGFWKWDSDPESLF